MKLYTEEQLLNTVKAVLEYDNEVRIEKHLKALQPIELPSDEEIEKKAEQMYPISKEYKEKYNNNYNDFNTCWQEGAKWLKEMILNQNK